MTAWIAYTDPLLVVVDRPYAGQNSPDNRTTWHDLSEVTLGTGGISGATWYRDSGPLGNDPAILEPRAFCTKGQVTFSFSGTTLIIRINHAFSWYTGAVVKIDSASPSTLGLLTYSDTLSCDAATYGLTGDGYRDVCVADGLSAGSHTCEITVNSVAADKFFSFSGFKVAGLASLPLSRGGAWLVPPATAILPQNLMQISLHNQSGKLMRNVSLTFPAGLLNETGGALSPLTTTTMGPGDVLTQSVLPQCSGTEVSGTLAFSLGLTADYVDPTGPLSLTSSTTIPASDTGNLTYTGTWYYDTLAPGSTYRRYTNDAAASIQLTFSGDTLDVTVEQTPSWGVLGIYASDNTTLLHSADCNTLVSDQLYTYHFSGFGSGSHTVHLRKTLADSTFVVLTSVAYTTTVNYSTIPETVALNVIAQQPYAMRAQNVSIGHYDASFDPPIAGAHDYTGTPVRLNADIVYTEVMARPPTFAVCYQAGFRDILSQYDILIIDPFAAHAADVLYWQSLGITVFGYISSGEESGVYSNRYDFTSALGPWQGTGPGGFGRWYMYTAHPSSGPPDRDGVWASFYTNPDPAYGWPDRLRDFYAPLVLGGPLSVTNELVTTKTATIPAGTRIVFDVAHTPIDPDQFILLGTLDGAHNYSAYTDFTFDSKTGAFVLAPTVSPAVTAGQQLKISYTRKGHYCDGVFFDTVDTPDVYASTAFGYVAVPGYATAFAAMINNFKAQFPSAKIISNRGFTVLNDIIRSCDGVMFESWLTLPTDPANLATTDYYIINDAPTIAANDAFNTQLRTLRVTHEFDVYSLNYCLPGSAGNTLRNYCRTIDAQHGYLSWQSIITLNAPEGNTVPFVRYKTKHV
jgi:hypothetical protein